MKLSRILFASLIVTAAAWVAFWVGYQRGILHGGRQVFAARYADIANEIYIYKRLKRGEQPNIQQDVQTQLDELELRSKLAAENQSLASALFDAIYRVPSLAMRLHEPEDLPPVSKLRDELDSQNSTNATRTQ